MSSPDDATLLLDYAQDVIVVLDDRGRFTYLNDAVERRLGHAPATLRGESAFAFVHPDDVPAVREAFERTIDRPGFAETAVEHRFRTAGGGWVWLESRMSNLTDEGLDGYVVSAREVTGRVEAERDREAAAARLREIAAAADDVLWTFAGDWSELVFVNDAYESVYGGDAAALDDDPRAFLATVHPDDRSAVRAGMERLSAGERVDMEYRVDPRTDYGTWVWVQARPIVEGDEVARVVGFSRDVTDRRRRERQLVVMDRLLRHNIRNDVNLVSGLSELAAERAPEVADLAGRIRATAEDLLASAEKQRDVIDCLRGDAGARRVDVARAAADAAEAVRDRHPAATVAVVGPRTAPARAVPEFERALAELVANGVDHCDAARPRVTVRVEVGVEVESAVDAGAGTDPADDGRVRVTVTDEAPPIPPAEAAVLRGAHGMTETRHSTGLGLWLVYWVVERSGGRIEVTPDDDGNEVRVVLPGPGASASTPADRDGRGDPGPLDGRGDRDDRRRTE